MDKPKTTNTGITNCEPHEFAAGGFLLFGSMLILMALMPLGIAVFIVFSVINHWIDPAQKIVVIKLSESVVSPQHAIGIFICIALVLFSIGATMLWLGKLATSNREQNVAARSRENAE